LPTHHQEVFDWAHTAERHYISGK